MLLIFSVPGKHIVHDFFPYAVLGRLTSMQRMGNLARPMKTAVRPRIVPLRGQWSLPLPSDQGSALTHFGTLPPAINGPESQCWRSRWRHLESLGYDTGRRMRDTLLGPLARVCVTCGIAPAGISFASVAVMAGFMAMARVDLRLAAAGLLIANLMDGLDGVVARQQLLASDRGKFTDVVCGSLNLALFGTGLVYAGLLDGALGVFGVFLLMFSKVLRMIHHGFIAPSDWLFKPVAGFTPNLICAAAGGLFLLKAFDVMTGSLNPWFAAFILILIVDVALAYAQVLKLRP